jgi:hypothetical protein
MADVYEQLTDSAYSSPAKAEEVNASLKWLNRLEFNDWLPPALAFAVRKRHSPEEMSRFFSDLERLAYALLILRAGVNERIERFSRLTKAIESGTNIWTDQGTLQLSETEQADVFDVLCGPVYESMSARARSTLLLRLDSLISGGGASYDYETITVEHVLPQNPLPDSEWILWFPDAQVRGALVHELGNLALLTRKKNSAASNYEFGRKKVAYFSRDGVSPFVLTTQVLQHREWTPAIVRARQAELVNCLERHWRLEDRKSRSEPTSPAPRDNGGDTDQTWRDDVRRALVELGGKSSLGEIYRVVARIRREAGRSVPQSIEATIRRTLEDHSSDSENYRPGRADLFWMPEGRGKGIWALRK